jgi:predicted ferric reductase
MIMGNYVLRLENLIQEVPVIYKFHKVLALLILVILQFHVTIIFQDGILILMVKLSIRF